MPGPVLVGCKRQGPDTQVSGQIINNHTNQKTVSFDNAMLGVHGQLPEMVTLQTCDGKGMGQYPGCILMPRCLEKPNFSGARALLVNVRIGQELSEREMQETSKGRRVHTGQCQLPPTSQQYSFLLLASDVG